MERSGIFVCVFALMLGSALKSYELIVNANPHCVEAIQQRCMRLYRDARRQSLRSMTILLNGGKRDTIAYTQAIAAKISKVYIGLNPVPKLLAYAPSGKIAELSDNIERIKIVAEGMGISRLRPEQETIIRASLAGKSILVNFPTGYGKSACFTLSAILHDSITVVIVPFVSIIESQLHVFASLHTKISDLSDILGCQSPISIYDVVGCFIGKDNRSRYLQKNLRGFSMDYRSTLNLNTEHSMLNEDHYITNILNKRLIYTTPESFLLIYNTVWHPLAQSKRLKRIVVDECHVLMSWAFVFKKDYIIVCKKIAWLRELFQTNISLFSGSLTEAKRSLLLSWIWNGDDIYYFTTRTILPSNVDFVITQCADQDEVLNRSLNQTKHFLSKYNTKTTDTAKPGCKGILFCLTKAECVNICKMLKTCGIHALPFHSTATTTLSTISKADVVVSTSSLSHGVDLQDVDFVIVCGCCFSINELIQYGGRCGRRGQPAVYNFIYSNTDLLRSLHLKIVTQNNKPKKIDMNDPNSLFILNETIKYVSFFAIDEFFQLYRFLKAAAPLTKQEDIKNSLSQHMKHDVIYLEDNLLVKQKQIFIVIVILIYYLTISFNIYSDRIAPPSNQNPAKEPPLFCYQSVPCHTYTEPKLMRLIRLDFIVAILTGDSDHVKCILMQCFSNDYLSGKKFSLSALANALLDQLDVLKHNLIDNECSIEHKSRRSLSQFELILNSLTSSAIHPIYLSTSLKDTNIDEISQDNDMELASQLQVDEPGCVANILLTMVEKILDLYNCTDVIQSTVTENEIIDTVLHALQLKALYLESSTESCKSIHNTRISASTSNFCLILWTRTVELFTKCIDTLFQKADK